ncbi:hypothetical protein glysoja_033228 [Glycine soja]|uniref:MICOS complex subunit Mic10 n=1 Tax=Glycine soja TaxID=3848 RepID=A0A0B2QH16_GLYSO|nr:hypothetical protein glysoja_033228 [Glycine soja]
MAEKKEMIPQQFDIDAKWDACIDLTVRRFVYSASAGAFGGLLFFRSPVTRWASIAFGAGVGIGSAYAECSRLFDGPPTNLPLPKVSETATQVGFVFYFLVYIFPPSLIINIVN